MPEAERNTRQIGAVVLAAGQSRRMGAPKLVLPWGNRTVIEQVVQTLLDAGISEIVVVIGGDGNAIAAVLNDYPVRLVPNPAYAYSEMVASLQIGIQSLAPGCQSVFIVLGDQPTIESQVVLKVVDRHLQTGSTITIPSYHMRRGHPWLVEKSHWQEILDLVPPMTLHNFLNKNNTDIDYIVVDTASVIEDLDTQEDYTLFKP